MISKTKYRSAMGMVLLALTPALRCVGSCLDRPPMSDIFLENTTAPSDADRRAALTEAEAGYKKNSDEVARHDEDAAAAEKAADSPPADLPADKRQAYVDQRKNDAQTASDAATEARERLKEAAKAVDEAKAAVAAGHD